MKKLINISILLICSYLSAQDFQLLQNLNSIQSDKEAISVAQSIATISENNLRFFKSKEFPEDHAFIVRFVPANITDQQYNAMDPADQEAFLTIKFDVSGSDHKIYKFKQATGSFQQILPFWKRSFHPDADAQRVPKDLKLQRLIDRAKNIDYYFQEDNEGWILRNQS